MDNSDIKDKDYESKLSNDQSSSPVEIKNISNTLDSINVLEKKIEEYQGKELKNKKSKSSIKKIHKTFIKKQNDLAKLASKQETQKHFAKKYSRVMYKAKTLMFAPLYSLDRKWKKMLLIVLIGILCGIISFLLLKNTGVYAAGLNGFAQGISRIAQVSIYKYNPATAELVYNILFWSLVFVLNIPFFIFSYFKINKEFTVHTITFMACTQLTGFLLGLIPNSNELFIFGATNHGIILNNHDQYKNIINSIQIISWDVNGATSYNGTKIASLFVYSSCFGLLNGLTLSMLYILNGCSGGTDFIATYISQKKSRSIGTILTYINILSLVIGVTIGSFVPVEILGGAAYINSEGATVPFNILDKLSLFFSPNMIASIFSTIISGIFVNLLFPKYKAINIKIFSNNIQIITNKLLQSDWQHQLAITNNPNSTFGWTAKSNIETLAFYIELPLLIQNVRQVDPDALIVTYPIRDIDGEIATASVN